MNNVTPIRGHFENPKLLLQHIAEDEDIKSLVVVTITKDDFVKFSHFEMTRANLAYVGAVLTEKALDEGFDD